MLIAGPGIKGGHQVDDFAYVWDIMPTVLELAGITHPEEFQSRQVERMRGKSLKSTLLGSTDPIYGADEFVGGELLNNKWMRQGDFKAVSVAPPYGKGTWHLYDLANDPGETRDLANEHPDILKKLEEAWNDYADDVGIVLSN
jgi:arylsulfatase